MVLDTTKSPMAGRREDAVLDAWLFATDHNPVRDVYVGGKQVISGGRHDEEDAIEQQFQAAVASLK